VERFRELLINLKVFKGVFILFRMRKINFLVLGLMFLVLVSCVSAEVEVSYFYGVGCPHCSQVVASGILEEVDGMDGVSVEMFEIYHNADGGKRFVEYMDRFGVSNYNRGVPFAVIECEETSTYIIGSSIINKLEDAVQTCEANEGSGDGVSPITPNAGKITLGALVVAAIIDSVNPCAFGVLIFLMLCLLKMGSAKRALRAGLVYTFVVFVVYFLSGLGIFEVIQSFTSVTHFIYMGAGVLVLVFGLWQFKDVFLPSIGPTLQISPKVRPTIEKIIQKGTIPAMILLGVVVSLFELPCTGGIYLGILTMMSINKTFAISSLLLYNFIFVLPLIVLTLLIYRGMSPEVLQRWTQGEKKWMKIGSGIVLVCLGIYILVF